MTSDRLRGHFEQCCEKMSHLTISVSILKWEIQSHSETIPLRLLLIMAVEQQILAMHSLEC